MITANETLQLNELLNLKSLSMTKTLLMSPMVSDTFLKEILAREAEICEEHIKELRSFMAQSNVKVEKTVNHFTKEGGEEE